MVDNPLFVLYNLYLHEQNLQKGARCCEKESIRRHEQQNTAPVSLTVSSYVEKVRYTVGATVCANGFCIAKKG